MALAGMPGLRPVHRLDRPVGGVLLFARDDEALRNLNEAFAQRRVRKRYRAIVEGRWEGPGVLEHWLVHDAKARRARVVPPGRKGAFPARLRVQVLATGDRYTLLEVAPEEGRFHQIRAQLAAAGHPIKGDVKYGARRGEADRSIALHAWRLELEHPVLGGELAIEAPEPSNGLWALLRPGA
jgi:23S rRNA pseudouridine1911/1915/1917 synthase